MPRATRPHLSTTLKHMRFGVTLGCWVIGLSLAVQTLTWAFVNFTDLRVEHAREAERPSTPKVVAGKRQTNRSATAAATGEVSPGTEATAESERHEPVDPNQVVSRYDSWFRAQHQLAMAAGLLAVPLLVLQLSTAVSVSAGGGVLGVVNVVRAHTWSLVLLVLALPWQSFMREVPYDGLFSTYDELTARSMAYEHGDADALPGLIFYGRFFLLPLAGVTASALVGLWFGAGVAADIIHSGPTPEELAIDAEASNRAAGSLVTAGRTGGAFRATGILASAAASAAGTAAADTHHKTLAAAVVDDDGDDDLSRRPI